MFYYHLKTSKADEYAANMQASICHESISPAINDPTITAHVFEFNDKYLRLTEE